MSQLILIAGVSRSGKSSLAKRLCAELKNAKHLDQDEFVKPESEIPTIQDRVDWETPESIDWVKWKEAIDQAKEKHEYVIAEGIFALSDKSLIKKADLTILLSISKEEFLERRRKETRWGEEPEWFIEHVWNSHLKYYNPHSTIVDFELTEVNSSLTTILGILTRN